MSDRENKERTLPMIKLRTALLVLMIGAGNTVSADVTKGVRSGSTSPDTGNGGYLELGIGLRLKTRSTIDKQDGNRYNKIGLVTNISGAYRYKGLFIEASQGVNDGISLGYNVWSDNNWAADIIAANAAGDASGGDPEPDYFSLTDAQRVQATEDRDSFYSGAGIRLTGYYGNAIVQYRLLTDTIDNNGIRSAARVGYSRQVKNWNFYGVLQADYNSRKTNRFWYGVTDVQANSRFPAYDLGSTIKYSGEIGVTYPVSENIVLRSNIRSVRMPDDIVNSPIRSPVSRTFYTAMISYVF